MVVNQSGELAVQRLHVVGPRGRDSFKKTIEFTSRELNDFDLIIGFNYEEIGLSCHERRLFQVGAALKYHLVGSRHLFEAYFTR
ncbi:MAG: hypothetical protein QXD04_00645 [Candidatus Bathyarchaeia archaeon]